MFFRSAVGYFGGALASLWIIFYAFHALGGWDAMVKSWWGIPAAVTAIFGVIFCAFGCMFAAEKYWK